MIQVTVYQVLPLTLRLPLFLHTFLTHPLRPCTVLPTTQAGHFPQSGILHLTHRPQLPRTGRPMAAATSFWLFFNTTFLARSIFFRISPPLDLLELRVECLRGASNFRCLFVSGGGLQVGFPVGEFPDFLLFGFFSGGLLDSLRPLILFFNWIFFSDSFLLGLGPAS